MKIHQTFYGFVIVHTEHGDLYLPYEGWEKDWNILGFDEFQNQQYTATRGHLFEIKLYDNEFAGESPDGQTRWWAGVGNSFSQALKSAKTCYILDLNRKKNNGK
jgi:hypothetical protein